MNLSPEVQELMAAKDRRIAELEALVAELLRRVGLDSTNSSKPPSSDGLKKKPRAPRSLRGKSGKASGGQEGHAGDTLRQVANPDFVIPHQASVCGHCCSPLGANSTIAVEKRQVFDVPERLLLVTEPQASVHRCAHCRRVTKAAFPAGVASPTQYGERFRAAAVYLNVQQLIPEDRTAQALSDLFGAPQVSAASVVGWVGKKAEELTPVCQGIGERVAEAKVRHLDETGYRIAGRLQWLHTTSSLGYTFYRAGEKRGDIPRGLQGGVVVHDHFKPYYRLLEVDHAFCNGHILRELVGLIEFYQEPWAEPMREVLLDACEAVRAAREAGKSRPRPRRGARTPSRRERAWGSAGRNAVATKADDSANPGTDTETAPRRRRGRRRRPAADADPERLPPCSPPQATSASMGRRPTRAAPSPIPRPLPAWELPSLNCRKK